MNTSLTVVRLTLGILLLPNCWAAQPETRSLTNAREAQDSGSRKTYFARGKVTHVDSKAGKVRIAYDPSKTIHLPRMSWPRLNRTYQVHDPALLRNIKTGMTVDFELQNVGHNTFHIVGIAPSKN